MCNREIDGKMVNDTCESCGLCKNDLKKIKTDIGDQEFCGECRK